MRIGTIVRNTYQPSFESLLVYTGTSGRYARCIWLLNGTIRGIHNFYKTDILNDREHFPIVGYVDYKKALTDAIRNSLFETNGDVTIERSVNHGE